MATAVLVSDPNYPPILCVHTPPAWSQASAACVIPRGLSASTNSTLITTLITNSKLAYTNITSPNPPGVKHTSGYPPGQMIGKKNNCWLLRGEDRGLRRREQTKEE